MQRAPLAIVCVAVLASYGAGCARPQAIEVPEEPRVALAPPPPPPRVVEPYVVELPPPDEVETVEAEEPEVSVQPPVRPPVAPPVATEPAPPPKPAGEPGLVLRAAGTDQKALDAIRNLLAQAARHLGRVNYQTLDRDARAQHDIARRFMQQAESALADGNLMFAGKLADKAASMAAILIR